MTVDETNAAPANLLCQACGLCCTGHLFIWAKLRPAELDAAEALGLHVFRSDPGQRGFSQPCPRWQGQCTIYTSPHYPHICRAYKCKLLKSLLGETTSLPSALSTLEQAKHMIHALETLLSISPEINFRERLVARLEHPEDFTGQGTELEFQEKAEALLVFYEQVFGVNDLLENPNQK
jgi:hypothetical protein